MDEETDQPFDYCNPGPDAWFYERWGKTLFCGVAEVGKTVAVPIAGEASDAAEDVAGAAGDAAKAASDVMFYNMMTGLAVLAVPVGAVALDFGVNNGKVTKGLLKLVGSVL